MDEPIAKVIFIEIRRYTPRNDREDTICLGERSEAIPLLNTFAITSDEKEYLFENH
jgi:hypothetical protein